MYFDVSRRMYKPVREKQIKQAEQIRVSNQRQSESRITNCFTRRPTSNHTSPPTQLQKNNTPTMPVDPLTLSPDIKNFVLLPIVLVTFLVNLGRTYVQQLIASQKVQEVKKAGYVQTLTRSRRTRQNAGFIRPEGFLSRQAHYSLKKEGVFSKVKDIPGPVNPMMQGGGGGGGGAM